MAGTLDSILQGAPLLEQRYRLAEIVLADRPLHQRALPELALGGGTAPVGKHHRKGDLPFAKIVAHVLAEGRRLAAVVKCVVDQLERDAKIGAVRAECGAHAALRA